MDRDAVIREGLVESSASRDDPSDSSESVVSSLSPEGKNPKAGGTAFEDGKMDG